MIEQLKSVPAREWLAALQREGFHLRKGRGSHHVYQHGDGRRVLVVYHKLSDTFGPKTIRQMLIATQWVGDDLKHVGLLK